VKPFILPGPRVYGCIDEQLLDNTFNKIFERFQILLTAGHQLRDLGGRMKAAGQYLNQFDFAQRGLFGTAAALYVVSQVRPDSQSVGLAQAMVDYLRARHDLEPALATTSQARAEIERRIAVEELDSFKTADLIYALAHVSHLVRERDVHLRLLTGKVLHARLPAGGWGTRLDQAEEFDPLATAHLVLALHKAGSPVDPLDLQRLRDHLEHSDTSASGPFVRSFVTLVLARIDLRANRPLIAREFKGLAHRFRADLGGSTEANYEYTADRRQYYVRIPWQLYLLEICLRLYPTTVFFTWTWQRPLLAVAAAVSSSDGFVYPASGSAQSTRTNAIVCDLFLQIRDVLATAPRVRLVSQSVNYVTRVAYSRMASFVCGMLAIALIIYTIMVWLGAPGHSVGELTPNFISAGILLIAQVGLRRFRR
jgi:hypothetical protein